MSASWGRLRSRMKRRALDERYCFIMRRKALFVFYGFLFYLMARARPCRRYQPSLCIAVHAIIA